MKPPRLLIVTVALLQLASFCNKGDDIVEPTNDENNVSTKINVTNQSAQVSIKNKIEITIPQGAFSGEATFTVKTLEPSSLPKPDKFSLLETFDVECSSGSTFAKDLEIKLKYDPTKGSKSSMGNGAAFYDEIQKKWVPFSDVLIDSVNSTIIIKTNHLCKLSRTSYEYLVNGFTDYLTSSHFKIYWREPGVRTNAEYQSPYALGNVGSEPYYIQDLRFYLEQAWTAFKALDFALPSGKITVEVTNTGQNDGITTNCGYIQINEKLDNNQGFTMAEKLQITCAHELFHYIQDYYYASVINYPIRWWLEATATLADILVWPNNPKFEIMQWQDGLRELIKKSWDTYWGDPNWYPAGCFIGYLIKYRSGVKANLPALIKQGGSDTDFSYMRTIVDNHIKSTIGSTGIGTEYANFIKWAFEQKGALKIISSPPVKGVTDSYYSAVYAPIVETTQNVSLSFPYLSVRSIKIAHDTSVDPRGEKEKEITIKAKNIPSDVSAYVYYMRDANVSFIKEIKNSEEVSYRLSKGSNWIEILLVNKSKDESRNYSFDIKSKAVDDILEILKKCNVVTVVVKGEHNVGKLTDNTISIFYPRTSVTQATPFDWNGLNFSQIKNLKYTTMLQMEEIQEVYGTVSKDGKVLEKITVKETKNEKYSDGKLRTSEITEISFINLPGDGITPTYSVTGVSCPNYIAFLKYQLIDYTYATPTLMKNYTSTNWNSTSTVVAGFGTE